MTLRLLLVTLSLLFVPLSAHAVDAPFDRLQGHAWALVLTGPEEDPLFTEELTLLEAEAQALKDREMVVIHFHGRTLKAYPDLSVANYVLPSLGGSRSGEQGHRVGQSSHDKIDRLESQLQTDDDVFSVVLVNKDGVTVYVWTEVVKPEDIYRVMDEPDIGAYTKPAVVTAPEEEKDSKMKLKSFEKAQEALKK